MVYNGPQGKSIPAVSTPPKVSDSNGGTAEKVAGDIKPEIYVPAKPGNKRTIK